MLSLDNTIIPRTSLMQDMDSLAAAPGTRLIYISAPAGYGKTISLSLWLKHRRANHAILRIDHQANEPATFCHRWCQALAECQPANTALSAILKHPGFEAAPDEFAVEAISLLDAELPFNIGIDDLHLLSNHRLLRLLILLLKRLPSHVYTLISSRLDLPMEFSEMLLKNELALLEAGMLLFSEVEIIQFYRQRQQSLRLEEALTIHRLTQGRAISISALQLSGQLSGEDQELIRHLDVFIEQHLWHQWPESHRDFMLKCSVAQELSPELCRCLSGCEDSLAMLEELFSNSIFLVRTVHGHFHFHQLFREVLMKRLQENDSDAFRALHCRAAEWFLQHQDFYRAVRHFIQCDDHDGIARCFDSLETMNRNHFQVDLILETLSLLDDKIAEDYPFLNFMLAWGAFMEGRAEEMARYMDSYYREYPRIVARNPELAHNILFLRFLDFRLGLRDLIAQLLSAPALPALHGIAGSMTLNLPLLHRSFRDFSEFADSTVVENIGSIVSFFGDLLGREKEMFQETLIAGLLYEQGKLSEAYHHALAANACIEANFVAESKFCSMNILLLIQYALHHQAEALQTKHYIEAMIDQHEAYYLRHHFEAVSLKLLLDDGDIDQAKLWLQRYGDEPKSALRFNRFYGYYATARAHIATAHYDAAIALLERLHRFANDSDRPLDVIEVQILLAIAYWQKKRSFQIKALQLLEEAILSAYPHNYIQCFVNEGSELVNMLNKLQSRAMRANYGGNLPGSFTRQLYLLCLQQADRHKGLTSGQNAKPLHFTMRQQEVVDLLGQGYSYNQIAEKLGVKYTTIRSHIELIYKKLDSSSEAQARARIRELGLTKM